MARESKDWLAESLPATRRLLARLPARTKEALDNEAKFQAVVRASEQAALVRR